MRCTPGATLESDGGCNTCTCTDSGDWACTLRICNLPAHCGGSSGKTCGAEEYCAYSPASGCGAANTLGNCLPRPPACDQRFAPVCGCNQKTYDNECLAAMDGMGLLTSAACDAPPCSDGQMRSDACSTCECIHGVWACDDRACPTPECKPGDTKSADDGCNTCSCTDLGWWVCTLRACGIDAGAPRWCGARAGNTCAPDEYCAYHAGEYCGAADAESTCKPRPGGCTLEYAPVCGCDQKTYANACAAAQSGTGVYSEGACP